MKDSWVTWTHAFDYSLFQPDLLSKPVKWPKIRPEKPPKRLQHSKSSKTLRRVCCVSSSDGHHRPGMSTDASSTFACYPALTKSLSKVPMLSPISIHLNPRMRIRPDRSYLPQVSLSKRLLSCYDRLRPVTRLSQTSKFGWPCMMLLSEDVSLHLL